MSQRFFRDQRLEEPLFFDEGPVISLRTSVSPLTSSINTVNVDQFRQGVELTRQRHFDQGFVKIYSGEPGHASLKCNYGSDTDFTNTTFFEDPASASDMYLDNNLTENGAIEPLTIRTVISFKNTERPVFHSIKCGIQSGNEDFLTATDVITSKYVFESEYQFIPFMDSLKLNYFTNNLTSSFDMDGHDAVIRDSILIKPFDDKRLILNEEVNSEANLTQFVSIHENQLQVEKFTTSGWTFDNCLMGTDSIAFGGMTY